MIKAEEAKELSKLYKKLNRIMQDVVNAAKKGETSVQISTISSKEELAELEKLGYKIGNELDCDNYIKKQWISW